MAATNSRSMAGMASKGMRSMCSRKRWLDSWRELQAEQAGQDGGIEPAGEACLGAGSEAAVEGGDQQAGADGGSGAALGGVAVDVLGELEAAGEGEQSGGGAELAHAGLDGPGGGLGGLDGGEDLVGVAEIGLGDDLGLAVDASGRRGRRSRGGRGRSFSRCWP